MPVGDVEHVGVVLLSKFGAVTCATASGTVQIALIVNDFRGHADRFIELHRLTAPGR